MNKKLLITTTLFVVFNFSSYAQFGKLKGMMGKKDSTQTEEPKDDKPKKEGGFGTGLMNKMMAKVAKSAVAAGGASLGMTGSTSDLSTVEPAGFYASNLHPIEVQEIGQNFFEGWEPGGTEVLLSFNSLVDFKFNKIDGEVKINGIPAKYISMGYYSAFYKDNTPKKVEVTTASGQTASFTMNAPQQKLKILNINGQTDNISLDLTKDMVINLEPMTADTQTPVMVQLAATILGIKTFYEVGWFAPKSKITIPAAMFRNMSGVQNNYGFSGCYIQLTRNKQEKATDVTGAFKEASYTSIINDGKFVTVTTKPAFNKGITAAGTEGSVTYDFKKTNAIFSQPFAKMKTLGVMAFAAKGTTYLYNETENNLLGIATTKEVTFPQYPNAVWESILDRTYSDIISILKEEFKVEVMPLEKVINSTAYKTTAAYSIPEKNTKEEFFITYNNTKQFNGLRPLAESQGPKTAENRLMQELGMNAILKLTLNFDLTFPEKHGIMTPSLVFEISGPQVGNSLPTNFITGKIMGKGFPLKNGEPLPPSKLEEEIFNRQAFSVGFKKAIQEIKAKEKENGDYDIEWAAMNQ